MSEDRPQARDRICLRRLAEGESDALEPIWEVHADRAFRHALWVTGQREDAEDIVQTVFVQLARLGAELLGIRDLRAYLGSMVHRESVAASRRRAERDGRSVVDAESLLVVAPDAERDVERRRVAALVAALPSDQRETI